jgi:hypothetical protein
LVTNNNKDGGFTFLWLVVVVFEIERKKKGIMTSSAVGAVYSSINRRERYQIIVYRQEEDMICNWNF